MLVGGVECHKYWSQVVTVVVSWFSQESPQLPGVLASGPLLPPGCNCRLDLLLDQSEQELKYDG